MRTAHIGLQDNLGSREPETDASFRSLIENASDITTILDAEAGIRYESPSAERTLGYKLEELVGHNAFEFIHSDDVPLVAKLFSALIKSSGTTESCEYRFRHKDGSWRVFQSIGTNLLDDPAVHGIIVNSRDITDRKRVEEALRGNEVKYRNLFETMREGFALCEIICGADGNPCDFRYLEVNVAFEKILGIKHDQAVGKTVRELFPQIESYWIVTYGKVALTGVPTRFDHYFQMLDRHFEVEAFSPRHGQFAAIFTDITERKKTEAALRESEELFRSLSASSPLGIFLADTEGRCTYVNPRTRQICGFTIMESQDEGWTNFIDPGERQTTIQRWLDYVKRGEGDFSSEACFQHHDGSLCQVQIRAAPMRSDKGKPMGFVGTIEDITERKQADQFLRETNTRLEHALEELQTAQQQVVQQERLRALGTMASGIAHDFNNALAAILGFSELLLYRPEMLDDKDKARRYLEMMNTAAKDAGSVVNRLREFYRHREHGEVFAPVDLNHLVEEAISLTQPKWKTQAEARGITIRTETDLQKIPPVPGNAADLREALTNLIFNAVDAMPHGGVITIGTHSHDSRVILEVSDTGTGMTEEIRRRCLEPFFTTKGERGTGLGLAMVYGIVQRHEGTIDIRTQLEKGTTFILSLPVKSQPQAAAESVVSAPTPLTSQRVLLVDDEEVVRKVLNEYLINDGHVVELAVNGKDGIDKFRKGQFDVVILDRAMPDMSGDQVGAAIKTSSPNLPVIMLTGFGSMMEAADEKPAGVDFVVSKPVTIDNLRKAIARAVARN